MVRDTEEGKLDYSLVLDGPMFKRWAAHLTKGAKKYAPRNWMRATSETEFDRFKRSFLRHTIAFLDGDRDEDHAAAIIFNVNGMEYVRDQIASTPDSYASSWRRSEPGELFTSPGGPGAPGRCSATRGLGGLQCLQFADHEDKHVYA